MRGDPYILLPREVVNHIRSSTDNSQILHMKYLESEGFYLVDRFSLSGSLVQVSIPREYRTLRLPSTQNATGQWFRSPGNGINAQHFMLIRRPGSSITFDAFQEIVPGVRDPGAGMGFTLTFDPEVPGELRDIGVQEFAGWLVERGGVQPVALAIEPNMYGLVQLADQWPIDRLLKDRVMVVGLGSIGGVVAENLAAMGVGKTLLVDPDRFLWHNIVRHVLGKESVGRLKVDAVRDRLKADWPDHESVALPYDVVEDAHLIRPLLEEVDLVVCTADGIAPRRVISHLARRAGIPAVLACVLDDGGIGEILRLRPGPNFGCLLCHRADLAARAAIDPEADQELAYGTGHVHKPMTAIPTDLSSISTLAAKVAVATLLESRHGEPQRLPGEHAVIGLRADLGLAAPYDVSRVGEVKWHNVPRPRTTCPTCNPT